MGNYPELAYSMSSVRRAGKRLASEIVWCPQERDDILQTFAIANSWRDSHVYPMRSVRLSVIQRIRHARLGGFTAARPKRMSSIRKKIQRLGCELDQINDLAGCRAVLDDIAAVRSLVKQCKSSFPHELRQEYDYIGGPKVDGYRSHHMVFLFDGKRRPEFGGRRVELQIRTRLQHSWATAVEAVGLFRGEDMKAGEGNPDWLRLFQLMSAEFAYSENAAGVPGTPDRNIRIAEIRQLNSKLRAAGVLEDLKNATHFVQNYIDERSSRYYLIRYDHATHEVEVQTYSSALDGSRSLGEMERKIELEHISSKVVLVEVDKIERLAEAYPNYFGDVSLFVKNLRSICEGQQAIEYSMAPQKVVAPRPLDKPDESWLRRRFRLWQ